MKFWFIQESYPGLIARKDVAVIPSTSLEQAEATVLKYELVDKGCNVHVTEATDEQVAVWAYEAVKMVERGKIYEGLLPYFDEALANM